MKILGVSCYHHDSAAATLKDGFITAASHEERFSREKFDKSFPQHTINWMRNSHDDWEFAAFYEESTYSEFKSEIKKFTRARPVLVDHHESHAMSSILMTDWTECAVMVVDTVGNKYSTSLGVYRNGKIEWLKRFRYPNSLGLFYSSATRLLGFTPLSDECKVMSAAAYGTPKWTPFIKEKILNWNYDGDYTLLQNLERGVGTGALDWDIAASVQNVLEIILLELSNWLYRETGMSKLAYAGGVALNCVANTYIKRYGYWDKIAIQPAAGDAGCALGAAALIERPMWENAYLGLSDSDGQTPDEVADKIIKGEIVPVIQGRAEFGPRALGNRSLLCAPFDDNIKKLNVIKKRDTDSWRPYAPVCQQKEAEDWFIIYEPSFEMLFTADIVGGNFMTHDKTARVQITNSSKNSFLNRVLELTRQKGYPILINTSLNAKGKPIVNTVEDFKREVQLYN
jgi:carbamoyltransferase